MARIGVLTPHADVGPESELQAMAPDDLVIHTARVRFGAMAAGGAMDPTIALAPVRAFANPPYVDKAVELLAAAPVSAIGYAFTSSAYVIGADGEASMVSRLQERAGGVPVLASTAASVQALRTLGVERLALIQPPWFDAELTELAASYFLTQEFDVRFCASAELPSDQRAIKLEDLHSWVTATVPDGAEAICIGGNGFRAVGSIEAMERDLGRPVVTANQALLWGLLASVRHSSRPSGYGRLFSCAAPE
ncbi:MAG: maleate cis-trans isomerase family protein [Solirubrobacteraceae bacterium]